MVWPLSALQVECTTTPRLTVASARHEGIVRARCPGVAPVPPPGLDTHIYIPLCYARGWVVFAFFLSCGNVFTTVNFLPDKCVPGLQPSHRSTACGVSQNIALNCFTFTCCCRLVHRLEWPLHLVLTRETMQTYNRLFRLLASVKRASLELERVWPTLMQTRYR